MARVLVITTPDLAPGFRLAGVRTRAAATPAEALGIVCEALADGATGVIGIHRPFLAAAPPGLRQRLEETVSPVVVGIPAGERELPETERRARLAEILQRAVGYHMTFRPEDGA